MKEKQIKIRKVSRNSRNGMIFVEGDDGVSYSGFQSDYRLKNQDAWDVGVSLKIEWQDKEYKGKTYHNIKTAEVQGVPPTSFSEPGDSVVIIEKLDKIIEILKGHAVDNVKKVFNTEEVEDQTEDMPF